jgi:hypothetical protein
VTELAANIRMNLDFDDTAIARPPSRFRQAGTAAARFEVQLLSEPYVLEARPNIPPPISFSQRPIFPTFPADIALDSLGDLRDAGVDDTQQNRLILARRAIIRRETSVVFNPSIQEQMVRPTDPIDPCGETQPFSIYLAGLASTLEERCYTYTSTAIPNGDEAGVLLERGDARYLGQLRILFQKDIRSGKIIGIRAFSFGGDLDIL